MKNNNELLHAYLKKIFILGVDITLVLILLPLALYLRLDTSDFIYRHGVTLGALVGAALFYIAANFLFYAVYKRFKSEFKVEKIVYFIHKTGDKN